MQFAGKPVRDGYNNHQENTGRIEVKKTTCYMCACRCGILVTLRDGEIRYIEGNPDHPLNKGVLCAKGSSGIMKQYSPARLTKPLRRKAGCQRGTSEFEAISWDEAFELIEERLGHIRKTDPKKFALFTGHDQKDPVYHRLRCLPIGDDRLCGFNPARHHLPGAS